VTHLKCGKEIGKEGKLVAKIEFNKKSNISILPRDQTHFQNISVSHN